MAGLHGSIVSDWWHTKGVPYDSHHSKVAWWH
jgi:hypothetical protein